MQKVKIKTINNATHVFIGDCELKDITGISFNQTVDTVPSFTFETLGFPEIETHSTDIISKFTPKTIQEAAKVIHHSFSADTILYDAIVASIAGVLKEIPADTGLYDVAKAVADRIIGK